ncbi:MAG: hypothetical protein JO301_12035 [Chitinophagaceae bacterium]|nr:hypothetical protein [Chitinophagaceae bacterium]
MSLEVTIKEFAEVVDEIYGVYLDATKGFVDNKTQMENIQHDSIAKLNVTLDHLDNAPMVYGKGPPGQPGTYILHECTQKKYKERNDKNGKNFILLANLCVMELYQYWEDHYRIKISEKIGIERNELKADIFGDIRLFRNSIVHHQGTALPEIEKCKILSWFKRNDKIIILPDLFEEIIYQVKIEIDSLLKEYCS